MTVTEIEPVSKTKSRVYLDGEPTFLLYRGELAKYRIRQGEELPREIVRELEEQVLPKRAKLRAMNLLKRRQYTEKQLTDKLIEGGYSRELAAEALAYVKSYRYVDDELYAYDYLSCHVDRSSRKELEQKLLQKGIDRQTIREAERKLAETGTEPDERTAIRRLLEKKHYDPEGMNENQKRRIYAYLCRKGFSMQQIRQVIEESFA